MSAVISACGRYRYHLARFDLGAGTKVAVFVMLNPSTADAEKDDRTLVKCRTFAAAWGFGRVEVVNLFAWRATCPLELAKLSISEAIGPENDEHIRRTVDAANLVVAAWGDGKGPRVTSMIAERRRDVRAIIERDGIEIHRLSTLTKARNPRHPLYLKGVLRPEPMPC